MLLWLCRAYVILVWGWSALSFSYSMEKDEEEEHKQIEMTVKSSSSAPSFSSSSHPSSKKDKTAHRDKGKQRETSFPTIHLDLGDGFDLISGASEFLFDQDREDLINRIVAVTQAQFSPIAVARRNSNLKDIHNLLIEPEGLLMTDQKVKFLMPPYPKTVDHPFFAGILDRADKLSKSGLCPQEILDQYKLYREQCITLQGDELLAYIAPKAILYIDDQHLYRVQSSLAYQINSINDYNLSNRSNDAGNHAVCALGPPGLSVHFKNNHCHTDLSPAMESAMYGFYSLFAAGSLIPSFFMRVEGLPIQSPQKHDVLNEWNQDVVTGKKTFNDFLINHADQQDHLFITKHQNFILQGSRTADGIRFDKFLMDVEEGTDSYESLNLESYSNHILLSLLFNPSDYKADNLFLDPKGNIIGIDNDGCLTNPIVHCKSDVLTPYWYYTMLECKAMGLPKPRVKLSDDKKEFYFTGVKNVLYLLPLMDDAIHETTIQKFKQTNILLTLFQWMRFLDGQDKRYESTFDMKGLERPIDDKHRFPVRLVPGTLMRIYKDLHRLQLILSDHHGLTHRHLLDQFQPLVGKAYAAYLEIYKTPSEAMEAIYKDNDSRDLGALLPEAKEELEKQAIHADEYTENRTTSLGAEIKSILGSLQDTDQHMVQVMDYLIRYLPDYVSDLPLVQNPDRVKKLFAVGAFIPCLTWVFNHPLKDEESLQNSLWHLAAGAITQGYYTTTKDSQDLVKLLKEQHDKHGLLCNPEERDHTKRTALDYLIEAKQFESALLWIQEGIGQFLSYKNASILFNHFRHNPDARSGLKTLVKLHQELSWTLSLETCLPQVDKTISRDQALKNRDYIIGCESGIRLLTEGAKGQLFDKDGKIIQVNTEGRHPVGVMVGPSEFQDSTLYFKFFPELPGVEEEVRYFIHGLFGTGLPFTELFRFENTPVLVSQGIAGNNLRKVLEADKLYLDQLDPIHTSAMILGAMLTNPEDGKRDNYVLHEDRFIYGIDNDRSFVPGVAKDKSLKEKIMVKTVLFCLDQMKEPIPEKHRQMIQALPMIEFVRGWLLRLKDLNERYQQLFPETNLVKELYNHKQYPCSVCVPFQPKAVERLFDKIARMKDALQNNPAITHLELLAALELDVARRYKQGFDNKKYSVLERFNRVDKPHFGTGALDETLTSISQVLRAQGIDQTADMMVLIQQGKQCGPRQALEELDDAIETHQMQNEEIQNLLQGRPIQKLLDHDIEKLFLQTKWDKKTPSEQALFLNLASGRSLKHLFLAGCSILTDTLLRPLLTDQLITLDVSRCSQLDEWVFNYLQDQAPQIESLNMSGCVKLKKMCYYRPVIVDLSCGLPHLRFLDLSDCIQLQTLLVNAPELTSLVINGCSSLTDESLDFLVENSPYLKRLKLDKCPLVKDQDLRKQFPSYPLTYFQWSDDKRRIILAIEDAQRTKNLELENELSSLQPQTRIFFLMMPKLKMMNLTALDLRMNQVGDEEALILRTLTNLTSLNIEDNQIGVKGARALSTLTKLTSLNLWWNNIRDEGVRALSTLTNLTSLDVRNNQIGAEGARTLSTLTKLTSLNVEWNKIGDDGARALSVLTNLTSLNIGWNQIGDDGARALSALTNLTSLIINYNQIGDDGAHALTSLTNLRLLDLERNKIGDAGAQSLTVFTTSTKLNLKNNNIQNLKGSLPLSIALQMNFKFFIDIVILTFYDDHYGRRISPMLFGNEPCGAKLVIGNSFFHSVHKNYKLTIWELQEQEGFVKINISHFRSLKNLSVILFIFNPSDMRNLDCCLSIFECNYKALQELSSTVPVVLVGIGNGNTQYESMIEDFRKKNNIVNYVCVKSIDSVEAAYIRHMICSYAIGNDKEIMEIKKNNNKA